MDPMMKQLARTKARADLEARPVRKRRSIAQGRNVVTRPARTHAGSSSGAPGEFDRGHAATALPPQGAESTDGMVGLGTESESLGFSLGLQGHGNLQNGGSASMEIANTEDGNTGRELGLGASGLLGLPTQVFNFEVGEGSAALVLEDSMSMGELGGRGNPHRPGNLRKPRGWMPPNIQARQRSPIVLRSRGTRMARPVILSTVPRDGIHLPHMPVEQTFSRSPLNLPTRRGRMVHQSRRGGVHIAAASAALLLQPTGAPNNGRSLEGPIPTNLQVAFDNAARTSQWVVDLAAAETPSLSDTWHGQQLHQRANVMPVIGGGDTFNVSPSGSVAHPQNKAEIPEGFNDTISIEGSMEGFLTPPRLAPPPLSEGPANGSDGWMTDSEERSWAPLFADFSGNSSDASNSDWMLVDDETDAEDDDFDVEQYREYTYVDPGQGAHIERIRHVYGDPEWDTTRPVLIGDRRSFTGPFPGPTQRCTRNKPTARSFFDRWYDDTTIDHLVLQTNTYALQAATNIADPRRRGRPAGSNGGARWFPTTRVEIRAFLGVTILMGLKKTPSIRDYWREDIFWRCGVIPMVFSRDRFECLLRCMHCVDNTTACRDKQDPVYDKLYKVRWLLEHFVAVSQSVYNPEKWITCDEVMVAYRGFRSPCRQYMPAKPTRYGFKFWAAVCVTSGFIWNLIPYLGKRPGEPEAGLSERVVHQLTAGLQHRGHSICVDNFFASPSLFDGLLQRGIFATGTVKTGRIGFPSMLTRFKKGQHPRSTIFWATHSSGKMSASVWYDSKPVAFLSTSTDPTGPAVAKRWLNGVREEIRTTPHQAEYQQNMRGVDLLDQMRQNYTTQFQSKKWWHRYFMFVVDSSLHNAWICYKHDRLARGERKIKRVSFMYDVAFGLIMPKVALPRTCSTWNHRPSALHYVQTHGQLRRRCCVCKRRQADYCQACGLVFMCRESCYPKVHSSKKWALRARDFAVRYHRS